jgi:hypothetical protein
VARTFGGVSTDAVVTGLTTHATLSSYSIWTYRTGAGAGAGGRMFEKRTGADGQVEVWYYNTSATDRYELLRNWSGAVGQWWIATPSANAWHHLVITYDTGAAGNNPVIYVDGGSVTVTRSSTPSGTANPNTSAYVLGNRTNDSARNWAGDLAEFAKWEGVLLGQGDVDTLFAGDSYTPLYVQRPFLEAYYEMGRAWSPEPDLTNQQTAATVTGTVFSTRTPNALRDPILAEPAKSFVYLRPNN